VTRIAKSEVGHDPGNMKEAEKIMLDKSCFGPG
jgi:hypothetical protein